MRASRSRLAPEEEPSGKEGEDDEDPDNGTENDTKQGKIAGMRRWGCRRRGCRR